MSRPHIRPEGDERWIYIAHRHWVALVWRSTIPFVAGLVIAILLLWRTLGREQDFLGRVPPLLDTTNVVLSILGLLMAAALAYIYVDWKNDHLIVSNKRIIYEDQTLWLAFTYQTMSLEHIQNVNVRLDNVLQYLLKYGRVVVQAAGPTAPIVFERAVRPNTIQQQVMKEVQREKRDQERRRLQAAVQRRLDPDAPTVPVPTVPVEQELRTTGSRLDAILPLGPVLEGNTIVWHKHWLMLLLDLLWPAVALLVWLVLLVVLPANGIIGTSGTALLFIFGGLAILLGFWWQYDNWRNDLYILEPSRLIDLRRLPFGLFEDRVEAPLGVIQNVNASAPNLIARIFGYGDVLVETAGATGNFTFDHVPDPDQVQRILFEYIERFRWSNREREWNNALAIVEMYHNTHPGGIPPP